MVPLVGTGGGGRAVGGAVGGDAVQIGEAHPVATVRLRGALEQHARLRREPLGVRASHFGGFAAPNILAFLANASARRYLYF